MWMLNLPFFMNTSSFPAYRFEVIEASMIMVLFVAPLNCNTFCSHMCCISLDKINVILILNIQNFVETFGKVEC